MKIILFFLYPLTVFSRTIIIGDSMFWSGMPFFRGQPSVLSTTLENLANHPIENYALVGASLHDGYVKSIPQQYYDINKIPTITTLIMDGGGNDVISHKDSCLSFNNECIDLINSSNNIVKNILSDARKNNISNIIYLGFYYLPGLEKAVSYGNRLISDSCKDNCHFVNPTYNSTTGIGLDTSKFLSYDGIHPTDDGFRILANMIMSVNITI